MVHHVLKNIIRTMAKVDQNARFNAQDSKGDLPPNLLVYVIDACHSYRMRNIIQEYGYPSVKLISKEGMKNWWILVQHQDLDIVLQQKCLEYCDFAPEEYALLADRVLVNTGKSQRYGTQLNAPIVNRRKIEAERLKLGLVSLKEYIARTKRFAKQYRKQEKKIGQPTVSS